MFLTTKGQIYKIGCCTLMTKTICEEKQKQIDSIFNSIEMGTQFRLRQELENLEDRAKVMLAGLEYESTEQIGEQYSNLKKPFNKSQKSGQSAP